MIDSARTRRLSSRMPKVSSLTQYPPALVLLAWLQQRWRGIPIAITPRVVGVDLMMHYQTVQKARDVLIGIGAIGPLAFPRVAKDRGPGRPPTFYILNPNFAAAKASGSNGELG